VAYTAADYCRRSEHLLVRAARDGTYKPPDWESRDGANPGAASARRAEEVHEQIRELLDHCEIEDGRHVLSI
jgi:hypothetical protein